MAQKRNGRGHTARSAPSTPSTQPTLAGWLKPAPQYDPALQGTSTVALGQYDPTGHMPSSSAWSSLRLLGQYAPSLLHGFWLEGAGQKKPAAQALGWALPLAQYLPCAQSTQLSCPALGCDVPAGHGRHGCLASAVK